MKLVLVVAISTLFIVTTISSAGLRELNKKVEIEATTPSAEPDAQESTAFNDTITSNPDPLGPLAPLGQDNDWNYWTNPPHMFSNVTGNVGIGTTNPAAKLDVRGSATFNDNGDDKDFRIESDTMANIFMVDASLNQIQVGIPHTGKSAGVILTLANNGNMPLEMISSSDTAANRNAFNLYRSRGTITAPTTVQNSDWLGDFLMKGYNGGSYTNACQLIAKVDGTPVSNSYTPGKFSFLTSNSSSGPLERMVIKANGNVGIGIASPLAKFQVDNGAVLFSGNTGGTPTSGAGTRLMWIPSKMAFRAGSVTGNEWDNSNIGPNSVAMGYSTKANGEYSTALGYSTTASGKYSIAMGDSTTASNYASTAMGGSTTASAQYSTAIGGSTKAFGWASTAMGHWTTASGYASTAMGEYAAASGSNSIAMGKNTTASEYGSTAIGYYTKALGFASTAMGAGTTANNYYTTAMGIGTTASGEYSTAMGFATLASGETSTAMGSGTIASGDGSTAMGVGTKASGVYSTVMGVDTTASGWYSTAMGTSTTASGNYSTAFGRSITVTGSDSVGIGLNSQAYTVSANNILSIMGGKVGIGTTSPSSSLEVSGIIHSSSGGFKFPDGTIQTSASSGGVGGSGTTGYIPKFTGSTTIGNSNIYQSGSNIGIGTPGGDTTVNSKFIVDPSGELNVKFNRATGYAAVLDFLTGGIKTWEFLIPSGQNNLWIRDSSNNIIQSFSQGGNVGIGTSSPTSRLDVRGKISVQSENTPNNDFAIYAESTDYGIYAKGDDVGIYATATDGGIGCETYVIGDSTSIGLSSTAGCTGANTAYGIVGKAHRSDNAGTYYSGYFEDMYSLGTYYGLYADYRTGGPIDIAEYIYDSKDNTRPGDVVIMDPNNDESVIKSSKPYDTSVLGVISTKPCMTMGMELIKNDSTGEINKDVNVCQLTLIGRVPVKVTDENGPIKRGDLITTSSKLGYAMKWTSVEYDSNDTVGEFTWKMNENERRNHAIIGKALEPHNTGDGEILVLINLQ